jgi:AraC family L-rhamnose operon transcriptional activator RhaR
MTGSPEKPLKHYHYLSDLPVGQDPAWTWAARGPHTQPIPLHDHDFLEFELVDGGSAEHISIHGRERVHAGHLFILHPGQWHGYQDLDGLVLHDIYFPIGLFTRELAWMHADRRLEPLFPLRTPRDERERRVSASQGLLSLRLDERSYAAIRACCGEIQKLVDAKGPSRRAALLGRALLLFDLVADHPVIHDARTRMTDPRIEAVCATMGSNLSRSWSVRELAMSVGLSESHFVRLMRAETGKSPIDWLLFRRAEHLAVLLLTRPESVSVLGREVGWQDPSYCARRFRSCMGCAPDEYRRLHMAHCETGSKSAATLRSARK